VAPSRSAKDPPAEAKAAPPDAAVGPSIETRKVQKSGRGSTVISLPKEWVQRTGLKPGDPVALHFQRDGSLLISPRLVESSPRLRCVIEVDATRPDRTTRQVIAAYLEGCGQIELRSKGEMPPTLRQKLHEGFRKIVGLEVVDEGRDRIMLLDLASPSEFPMGRGLRRMNMLTRAMVEDAMATVVDGEGDRLPSVLARDDEVDRIFWLVFKQHHLVLRDPRFAGKIEMTPQRSLGYMLAARIFERVADHACVIARSSADLKGALPKSIAEGLREAGKDALELLDRAFQCFVGAAGDQAHEVIEQVRPFEKRVANLRESIGGLKGRQAVALAYVLESIERTGAYAADLAELAINSSVVTSS
jgi:phosphate uptake regulator